MHIQQYSHSTYDTIIQSSALQTAENQFGSKKVESDKKVTLFFCTKTLMMSLSHCQHSKHIDSQLNPPRA